MKKPNSSNKSTNELETNKIDLSFIIRKVAQAHASGMYTQSMIAEYLSDDGFSDSEINDIFDAAYFLQESMFLSLKNLAGISKN